MLQSFKTNIKKGETHQMARVKKLPEEWTIEQYNNDSLLIFDDRRSYRIVISQITHEYVGRSKVEINLVSGKFITIDFEIEKNLQDFLTKYKTLVSDGELMRIKG